MVTRTSRPRRTTPDSGVTAPTNTRANVDLPLPLRPTIASRSPVLRVSDTLSNNGRSGRLMLTPWASTRITVTRLGRKCPGPERPPAERNTRARAAPGRAGLGSIEMSDDQPITSSRDGDVAIVRMDDGKANALSHASIDALNAALTAAERYAHSVVLVGRPGRFCAGFDLSVINAGPAEMQALVRRGGELAVRLFMFPRPVVAACTGHALAAGAIILMASDHRVGAQGAFKIGLNEV